MTKSVDRSIPPSSARASLAGFRFGIETRELELLRAMSTAEDVQETAVGRALALDMVRGGGSAEEVAALWLVIINIM